MKMRTRRWGRRLQAGGRRLREAGRTARVLLHGLLGHAACGLLLWIAFRWLTGLDGRPPFWLAAGWFALFFILQIMIAACRTVSLYRRHRRPALEAPVRRVFTRKVLYAPGPEGTAGAALAGRDLSGAYLSDRDLSAADLRGADLREAWLNGTRLAGADLEGASLAGASLVGADLRESCLRQADLTGAILYRADLRGADLRGANLTGASLEDCFFLNAARLEGAWCDESTRWPPGFAPGRHGSIRKALEPVPAAGPGGTGRELSGEMGEDCHA